MSHHYYATTAFGWATAKTRAEAIKKVTRISGGSSTVKSQLKANGEGLYCWTVRIDLPSDAQYAIENYSPIDVPMEDVREFNIIAANGGSLPIDRYKDAT